MSTAHLPDASAHARRRDMAVLAAGFAVGPLGLGPLATAAAETRRLVLGYPAGPFDTICRRLAQRLKAQTGLVTIVENRVGAAGRLAVEAVRSAPADGTTLLITPASVLALYPHVYRKLSYNPFADFAPVRLVAQTHFVLAVGPQVPSSVDSLASFSTWCRAHPHAANCANSGAGSLQHFIAVLIAKELELPLTHVPFQGGGPAMQAVAGAQVAAALGTEAAALPLVRAGRLRVLAGTGLSRSKQLPDVPTFAELGRPKLARHEWFGVFVPAATQPAALAAASHQLAEAFDDEEVRDVMIKVGFNPDNGTPMQLAASLKSEHEFWGPIVKASGFTPES